MAIHFFNGDFIPKEAIKFSINDVGILRGYGLFDFFRVLDGVPVFMDDHLDRFERSAKLMGMELPYSRQKIEEAIRELIKVNGLPLGSIKLVLTGGESPDGFASGKPNLVILNEALRLLPEHKYTEGVSLMTLDYTRDFPLAKSTNYAVAVGLQREWLQKGHEDVLYHAGGKVWEVSRSNVFFFKEGKLITNEDGVLLGITRKHVLKIAEGMFEVEIRDFTLDELLASEEMFITGSNRQLLPVVKLDDKVIANGKVGERTGKLVEELGAYVSKYVRAHAVK